jgi:hypothetical protein
MLEKLEQEHRGSGIAQQFFLTVYYLIKNWSSMTELHISTDHFDPEGKTVLFQAVHSGKPGLNGAFVLTVLTQEVTVQWSTHT